MLPKGHQPVILRHSTMNSISPRRVPRRWPIALLTFAFLFATGFTVVRANMLGMGERFDRLTSRIEAFVDPPPDRSTIPTVVVTPAPSATPSPTPRVTLEPSASPTPSPTPLVRTAVDITVVDDHAAVFTSQISTKDCAVAATQMVLTILGLGDPGNAFQTEIHDRIGEWESWEDSHNGGWGPAAVSLALAAYGEPGYEIRAYSSYTDALRDSAIAITEMDKPVLMFPWWGAHTWVMTGFRADADPTLFADAAISGAYILDPWYPRVSSIWGPSDPAGTFQDGAEMQRNFLPWKRPEGRYADRDGLWITVAPTIPVEAAG
jgi:hypothetical protein